MRLTKRTVFPQSAELNRIFELTGWKLYDVTDAPKGRAYSWDELNRMKPATKFVVGRNYFLIPKPTGGQTLRDAYSVRRGVGPSLRIEDPDDSRWFALEVHSPHHIAIFTRLMFHEDALVAMVPESAGTPNPDIVGIRYDAVVDTFQRFYGIVTADGYRLGIQRPVSDYAGVDA